MHSCETALAISRNEELKGLVQYYYYGGYRIGEKKKEGRRGARVVRQGREIERTWNDRSSLSSTHLMGFLHQDVIWSVRTRRTKKERTEAWG